MWRVDLRHRIQLWGIVALVGISLSSAHAQQYGQPDRDNPGDAAIQAYLASQADALHATYLQEVSSRAQWEALRSRYEREYYYMLGLWPLPEKSPLQATITGSWKGDGYVVDMLHYQSQPGLYVTGNLYRPAAVAPGSRLPAVFYVCGHSHRGRDGNKTAYQSHGIWFARHGYLCLIVDSLQLGEIAATHHGTYREGRWWWLSRGYTPAGVECWNGIRGIDYLVSREDVDPERIAVTGISGGGAATFWIAAADPRVAVAVPVSGMADLPSYVNHRVINGHCDCMFLHNAYRWPWTRIAALIAPRPLLFTNSDQDAIFPMDANHRVSNRLEQMYSLYGRGDVFDTLVSIGGHAYRQDIRSGAYRFINTYLKNDPREVLDSEVDLVTREPNAEHPIAPQQLRVFPSDDDLPRDARNAVIDESFVPVANVAPPEPTQGAQWKEGLVRQLREVTFGYFPDRIPPARPQAGAAPLAFTGSEMLDTEPFIVVRARMIRRGDGSPPPVYLVVDLQGGVQQLPAALEQQVREEQATVYVLEPRGVGPGRWTTKSPPNYVARSHVLLGRTFETGQLWDVIATARMLQARHTGSGKVNVVGQQAAGVLAAYAALLEPEIRAVVVDPLESHRDPAAPCFLNVLRVCDIPEVLGMLDPGALTLVRGTPALRERVQRLQAAVARQ